MRLIAAITRDLQEDPEDGVGIHVVVVVLIADLLDLRLSACYVTGGRPGDYGDVGCAAGEGQANAQVQHSGLKRPGPRDYFGTAGG
jgi:hypothetical protein